MATPLHGQVAVSGTAAQITTATFPQAFTIKAPLSNNNPVYVGASTVTTGNGHQLDPGDTFDYERKSVSGLPRYELNLTDFWAVGTSGDKITWFGTP